jgi:hypothetical protein
MDETETERRGAIIREFLIAAGDALLLVQDQPVETRPRFDVVQASAVIAWLSARNMTGQWGN